MNLWHRVAISFSFQATAFTGMSAFGLIHWASPASLTLIALLCYLIGVVHGHRTRTKDRGDTRSDTNTRLVADDLPGTSADAGTGPWLDGPLRAWKYARLTWDPERPFLGYGDTTYGVEAVAVCRGGYAPYEKQPHDERCPDPNCTCGFYALTEAERPAPPTGDKVLLEVELYGRVMVGDRGYRAEKQRVLAVWASRNYAQECHIAIGKQRDAYSGYPRTEYCRESAHFMVGDRPLCAQHALATGKRMREYEFTPPDTGTEWRWIESTHDRLDTQCP